jgi:CRISPR/Cas system-associated exonuclease Cas4 (RecB family)
VGALIFHNLEENVPVITMRAEAELMGARDAVQRAAQGIADGVFTAKVGNHCSFCAYRSLCPKKEKRIPHPAEVEAGQPN